ncbi:hypothetical protein ACCO45_007885 [Purpureocillium lilacinum]|uniref:Uncharacterized protein n=1 Tax=Purpureocillium lilacinum TaxID=33203 RepID=A0ACC4DLP6_PURLI
MEGKRHSSEAYNVNGRISRMQEDLLLCSEDFVSSFKPRRATRTRASQATGVPLQRPHVAIVGAGLAGLRCAEVLLSKGAKVTILEGRSRIGGRIHQASLQGRTVDMGPNWIHGTKDNPLVKLAQETNTDLCSVDDSTSVYDPQGLPITNEEATAGFEKVWTFISDAFRYSNEQCRSIRASMSLKDFFLEKLSGQSNSEERGLVLLLAEVWGSFIGDPWEKQSLKWFWLEECLDGDNLYVSGSHEAIVRRIAEYVLSRAKIHFSTKVTSVESTITEGGDPIVVVRAENSCFEFDEVVIAVPLGCLKREQPTILPPMASNLRQAIKNASYSSLEKVYVSFPVDFWSEKASGCQLSGNESQAKMSPSPSFAHFLQPQYVPEHQKSWTIEVVPLSSPAQFGDQAQATLLFYLYGPCATYVTSLIRELPPTSSEYINKLVEFFRPYYSRLPNYKDDHPDCVPNAVLATNWQNDDLAGNGSYTNFKVSEDVQDGQGEVRLDEDIRAMRLGIPERGIWFAGEHTAPFVALGTSTGAYWSGESAAVKILAANGLLQRSANSCDAVGSSDPWQPTMQAAPLIQGSFHSSSFGSRQCGKV